MSIRVIISCVGGVKRWISRRCLSRSSVSRRRGVSGVRSSARSLTPARSPRSPRWQIEVSHAAVPGSCTEADPDGWSCRRTRRSADFYHQAQGDYVDTPIYSTATLNITTGSGQEVKDAPFLPQLTKVLYKHKTFALWSITLWWCMICKSSATSRRHKSSGLIRSNKQKIS